MIDRLSFRFCPRWPEMQLAPIRMTHFGMCCSHLFNDPFLQQALLFGSHDKVVGVIFIIDNILQIDACSESRAGKEREPDRLTQ